MISPRILRSGFLSLCAGVLCASFARAEDEPKPVLDGIRKELGELIQMEIREGRLALVRKNWADLDQAPPPGVEKSYTHAQQLFDRLLSKMCDPMEKGQFMAFSKLDGERKVARAECEETYAIATMQYDGGRDRFYFKLTERTGAKRTLLIDDSDPDAGLLLQADQSPIDSYTRIQQCADGTLVLLSRRGNDRVRLMGDNIEALLKAEPGKVQVIFLRAFTDLGVQLVPYKFLPTAMAAATSGFGQTSPQTLAEVKNELEELKSDDEAKRAKATTELIKLFPLAVSYIKDTAEKADDPEIKTRLAKVIAAHPGIAKILPWVEAQKLHEDRAYLLDLLANVPFFKASARARLTEVCGKDFGDDPAEWLKP